MQPGYIKSRVAAAEIAPYALATFAAQKNAVKTATGPTDPFGGVADSMGGGGAGGPLVDVQLTEIADVRAGATIMQGDDLTAHADGSGRAVKAVKQAGATVTIHGIAQTSALEGDILPMLIAPSRIVG